MIQLNYPKLDETIYHEVLANGLNVYILNKVGFSKTYVTFSTNLGSLQTTIYNNHEEIDLPQGIAHFLEHKLFEQDGVDISSKFALNQANVNAYTQHNRTTYLFSATDKIKENIKLLMDFVLYPKFTDEGIKKEIGIITQEINMYQDDPNSAIYNGILNNLFKSHPIQQEILGTVESINTVTKDILEKTHSTFYHPENMVLFIAGAVDPTEMLDFVKSNLKDTVRPQYKVKDIPFATPSINLKSDQADKDIKVPNYCLGIKLPICKDKSKLLKREMALSVLMDLVIGKSTTNYKELIEEHLINDSFGMDINFNEHYAYFLVGSETNKVEELDLKLRHIFKNITNLEITDEHFLKTKKQAIGGFIQALNSLEYIANSFVKYHYQGSSLFDLLEVSQSISKEDIYHMMDFFQNEDVYTTFTIYPKK